MKTSHLLVVGGSRGLGRAFVELATNNGWLVSSIARTAPKFVMQSESYLCDVTNRADVHHKLNEITSKRGPFHGLAFFQRFRGGGDQWEGELQTGLTGTRNVIEETITRLQPSPTTSIVIVSSVNARFISPSLSCGYHVVKAGVCQMARYYAMLYGPKGVRVNTVCPGTFVKPESEEYYYRINPELREKLASASALSRIGTWTDVGNAILFFLSERAAFITGQTLYVDGGASLQSQESRLAGPTPPTS